MNPIAYAQIEQSAKYLNIDGIVLSLSPKDAMGETCGISNQAPTRTMAGMLQGVNFAALKGIVTAPENAAPTSGLNLDVSNNIGRS